MIRFERRVIESCSLADMGVSHTDESLVLAFVVWIVCQRVGNFHHLEQQ